MPGKGTRGPTKNSEVSPRSERTSPGLLDSAVDHGNAFMQSALGFVSGSPGMGGSEAQVPPVDGTVAATEVREVQGEGGFVYAQYSDGLIRVISGPSAANHTFPAESAINQAITREIGPFPDAGQQVSDGETSRTAGASAAAEVPRLFGNVLATLAKGAVTASAYAVGPADQLAGAATSLKESAAAGASQTANRVREWWRDDEQAEPSPATKALPPDSMSSEIEERNVESDVPLGNHTSKSSFVGDAVEEIGVTTRILDTIYRYFPEEDHVVSGFLDSSQQGWKVNFHWEYMHDMVDEAMGQGADGELQAIKDALDAVPPSGSGYRQDANAGDTGDSSTNDELMLRWRTVNAQKRVLHPILERIQPWSSSRYSAEDFYLASARVAEPGTSKHGSGKALDIRGDNSRIVAISSSLGATTTYNEASHIHVEFLAGVTIPDHEDL